MKELILVIVLLCIGNIGIVNLHFSQEAKISKLKDGQAEIHTRLLNKIQELSERSHQRETELQRLIERKEREMLVLFHQVNNKPDANKFERR